MRRGSAPASPQERALRRAVLALAARVVASLAGRLLKAIACRHLARSSLGQWSAFAESHAAVRQHRSALDRTRRLRCYVRRWAARSRACRADPFALTVLRLRWLRGALLRAEVEGLRPSARRK